MDTLWRRYLRILVKKENISGTTLGQAITDNHGYTYNIEGTGSTAITIYDLEVDILDEETARQRISGNDEHLRQFDCFSLKTIYRLTLPDGQRLIYVQSIDCYESFVTQDSHKSFDHHEV